MPLKGEFNTRSVYELTSDYVLEAPHAAMPPSDMASSSAAFMLLRYATSCVWYGDVVSTTNSMIGSAIGVSVGDTILESEVRRRTKPIAVQ